MGAEVGATTSTFPYTPNMRAYLKSTGRSVVASAADEAAAKGYLQADEGAEYDEVIDIVSRTFLYFMIVSEQRLRIYQSSSPLSTDHSPLIWQRLFPSSALS